MIAPGLATILNYGCGSMDNPLLKSLGISKYLEFCNAGIAETMKEKLTFHRVLASSWLYRIDHLLVNESVIFSC